MQAERDFISFKVLLPTVTVPASITFDDGNQKKHFHPASNCAPSWNMCFEDLKGIREIEEKKNIYIRQPSSPHAFIT